MAVEKIVNIKVTETGLDEINKDLVSLDKNLDKVSGTGEKAADSVNEVAGNGGAIAILDSLTGGLATRMRDAWEATKLFNTSLKGTRAALIATGIGAIVVALGAIVAYWDDIVEFITGANKALQEQINLHNEIIGQLDHELELLDIKEDILELEGKSTKEIKKERERILLILQEENTELLNKLKTQLETEKAQARELTFWEKLKKIREPFGFGKVKGSISEDEKARIDEIQNQFDSAEKRAEQLRLKLLQINQPDEPPTPPTPPPQTRDIGGRVSELDPVGSTTDQDTQRQIEAATKRAEIREQELKNNIAAQEILTQVEKEGAEERKRIADAEAEHKQNQSDVIFNSAQNLSNALMMLGEENKAFAVAGIIVDQVASAAKAIQSNVEANAKAVAAFPLTAGQPWVSINTASTVLGIAAGAAAAAKAISKIGGGGSAERFRVPGGGVSAPSFNVVGTSGQNQIAEALSQDQQPIKAYVVGSEVTSQQSLDRNIVQTATIVD